jgi:hypothetical protein
MVRLKGAGHFKQSQATNQNSKKSKGKGAKMQNS